MRTEASDESMMDSCCTLPAWTPQEVEAIVVHERLSRYNLDLPCGPRALRKHLQEVLHPHPMPSERSIARMLKRNGLTNGRTGRYPGDEPEVIRAAQSGTTTTERR